jgi:hypothetical protein
VSILWCILRHAGIVVMAAMPVAGCSMISAAYSAMPLGRAAVGHLGNLTIELEHTKVI